MWPSDWLVPTHIQCMRQWYLANNSLYFLSELRMQPSDWSVPTHIWGSGTMVQHVDEQHHSCCRNAYTYDVIPVHFVSNHVHISSSWWHTDLHSVPSFSTKQSCWTIHSHAATIWSVLYNYIPQLMGVCSIVAPACSTVPPADTTSVRTDRTGHSTSRFWITSLS